MKDTRKGEQFLARLLNNARDWQWFESYTPNVDLDPPMPPVEGFAHPLTVRAVWKRRIDRSRKRREKQL